MKKIIICMIVALSLASCKKKDYAEFTIKFDNLQPTDTVLTLRSSDVTKEIKINEKGEFHDTIRLKKGGFVRFLLNRQTFIQSFINNDFNINMSADVNNIDSTLAISGKGSENTKYLYTRIKEVTAFSKTLAELFVKDSAEFINDLNTFKTKMSDLVTKNSALDTALVNIEKKGLNQYIDMNISAYPTQHATLIRFSRGKPSPTFENIRNYNGGKTSLSDFKGKYVFIDFWATWCKPCLAQIPAIKELEEKYRDKNIAFVGISTDDEADFDKWKKMVKEQELVGTQLFLGQDIKFSHDYVVRNIPRFVMIDPDGNIFEAKAPRPTDKEAIETLFEKAALQPTNNS